MSRYDLIVRGGAVVLDDAVVAADVAVADGVVAAIGPQLEGGGREELDAAGCHVLPGAIDPHVHFDEPGRAHWEGFASGSAALAAGGATAYVDMPLNNQPSTIDGESFDVKLEAGERDSLLDFGLWGGLVPGNVDRLEELADRGVAGFKAFTCHSGVDDFPGVDDLTLYEGMARCAELGLPLLLHAENAGIVGGLAARARAEGRTGVRDFLASRPVVSETEAIARSIHFAEETGCRVHIVHVSTGRGVRLVAEARARGVDVSCETCAHYLVFDGEDVERLGVALKSAPPVRDAENRADLWSLLADGTLPMVTSDHSPGPPELKQGEDFFGLWGGISGAQVTRGVLLMQAFRQGMSLPEIARVTGRNVAERFELPGKGSIAVGADADLAVVDLAHAGPVPADELQYRHSLTCFADVPVRGKVRRTLARGRTVWADGAVVGAGGGRLIRPAPDARGAQAVARYRALAERLRREVGASRVTVRLAHPTTNDVALLAEARGSEVRSMRAGATIDINAAATYRLIARTRGLLVQPDCRAGDPPPPATLMDVYGVLAQVVAPLFAGDELVGSISVHQVGRTREWSEQDLAAIARAGALVQRMVGQWPSIR